MNKETVYKILQERFLQRLQKQKPASLAKLNLKPVHKVFGNTIKEELPILV